MTASVQLEKVDGRESEGACHQDEPIGGKTPVVKQVTLTLQNKESRQKIVVTEIDCENVKLIDLAQDRVRLLRILRYNILVL
jgi:hypothetical protein